jgi:hypothetical protein
MIALALISAVCATAGAPPMEAPDPDCTPGSTVTLTRKQVCTSTPRPATPASVRREVLADYGVPGWTGSDGEIDHRVPWFLTHETSVRNLWPERGRIPNRKDELEAYVYRRVCRAGTMRVSTARRSFLGDWRVSWRRWIG